MKKQQQEGDCPLQLSECFGTCCRYFLKCKGRCAYSEIKALERKQRQQAEESQGPARRISGEVCRMQSEHRGRPAKVASVRMKD